jgi:hypothetical protein
MPNDIRTTRQGYLLGTQTVNEGGKSVICLGEELFPPFVLELSLLGIEFDPDQNQIQKTRPERERARAAGP